LLAGFFTFEHPQPLQRRAESNRPESFGPTLEIALRV
jgi:hypothetical protein